MDNGISVFAYFNNDWNTRAPSNAEMFREMVTKSIGRKRMQRTQKREALHSR
jgi:uncharacterized protein YecE (DUF72 family)